MSVHKTWRDVAAHWAAWIYERLNGWCNERPWFEKRAPEYLADSARLMKCPDLGTAPDKLMESLKSDVKFYRWTDSHVIQPLNSVDYKSKEATAEVVRICERINRLHDRLLDGGKADDLLVEVPMEPSNRSQQLASAMSYLVRKDTLDERSQATDMVRKHTGLELPHSDDLSDSELIELASSFPGVVVGRNVDWEELKGWALNHGLSPQAARDLRPKEMLGWWRAHQSKGVTAEVKPMKKDKGERIFTVEELRKETQTRPPGWTQKMWASAQRFPELSPADRAIVLDRYHEIAGPSVPAVPDDAGADWWWATDNHRPEALLQAMQEADFIKKTPVEAVAVSNAAPQAAETKKEPPTLPASQPNAEQVVQVQTNNGEVYAEVDTSLKAFKRGEPLPQPELVRKAGLEGPYAMHKPMAQLLAKLRSEPDTWQSVFILCGRKKGKAHSDAKKNLESLKKKRLAEKESDGERWRLGAAAFPDKGATKGATI